MKRKIVETSVTHPLAVKIMEELDGTLVRVNYLHHETMQPSNATYQVEFASRSDA